MVKKINISKNTKINSSNKSIETKNKLGKVRINSNGIVDLEISTPIKKIKYKGKKNLFSFVKNLFKLK